MTVRVKICGIRNQSDLAAAIQSKPDELGFILGEKATGNRITAESLAELAPRVPDGTNIVLVTDSLDAEEIVSLAERIGAKRIQISNRHGLVVTRAVRKLWHGDIAHVIHVDGRVAIDRAVKAQSYCTHIHLDTPAPDRLGGTGTVHDWSISRSIVERVDRPVILSGGLNPENLSQAIQQVRPATVDVETGVKHPDGATDPDLVAAFVAAARAA